MTGYIIVELQKLLLKVPGMPHCAEFPSSVIVRSKYGGGKILISVLVFLTPRRDNREVMETKAQMRRLSGKSGWETLLYYFMSSREVFVHLTSLLF